MLQQERVIAFDTETSGLEETDRLFGYSVATRHNQSFVRTTDLASIKQLAQDPERTWLMNNALFDMRMAGYAGVEFVGPVIDIGVMARLLKNDYIGTRDYSLAAQAKRFGWEKNSEVDKYIKENGLYEERRDYFGQVYKSPRYDWVPEDMMSRYAAQDARLTYDLYLQYSSLLSPEEMQIVEMESKLTKVIYKMERTGICLDIPYTLKAMYHERELANVARAKYHEATGHDFVSSAKSVEKHLGITLPTTDKGNPTLTDDVIEDLVGTYPSLELVRTIKYHDKRISTYFENYMNAQYKGIVRPSFHQYGTRTGRFSSSNPNIQNVPAEEDGEFTVRGCFIPHPGDVFVAIDYKAQEFRLALDYAGETKLISQIMEGHDPHQATADMVGLPRKQAKNCSFAALYGAGPAKFALMIGQTEAQAKKILITYFSKLSKLENLLWHIQKVGKTRGYVKNWIGRKLRADYNHCYALPNHLIQSSGADVMKMAMVEIAEYLKDKPMIKMIATIHDELVFSMPESELHHVRELQRIMESQYKPKNGMVLHTDASISRKTLAKRDMEPLWK